jgi:hypothetical protein
MVLPDFLATGLPQPLFSDDAVVFRVDEFQRELFNRAGGASVLRCQGLL